jgi:hypothetical protein
MMTGEFADGGIRFQYPENWRLEREDNQEGWTVLLQSPGTAFMTITLNEEMPTTEAMAETALTAMKEVYPDLEADECVDSIAGQPAVGHDMRFFSLDLTNTCWTRSFYCSRGTVLVLCQMNDLEQDAHEPVLKAICASLELEED